MSQTQRLSGPVEVVIVGGGVAALEALMALRAHAGDELGITLVAPQPEFVYRPMMVAEPFDMGSVRRYPLRQIGSDFGAGVLHGAVTGVDAGDRRVVLRSGDTVGYETLILAPGARMLRAFDDAIAFGEPDSGTAMRGLLADLDEGRARRVAFVAPTAAGWLLPLYELALLTARHVADRGLAVELVLITPESQPLALFGPGPSAAVARLLDAGGVEFIGATLGDVTADGVRLVPGARVVPVDRTVALPLVRGPKLDGIPAEPEYGFIPVDRHGRVPGLDNVYAAGDATDFPVKQGGLAAQQADAVAEHVAARHGADLSPAPFSPVLRGMLFTGDQPRYLSDEAGEGPASSRPLWWPPTKIAGRHLAPYLLERDEVEARAITRAPEGFDEVEIGLEGAELK